MTLNVLQELTVFLSCFPILTPKHGPVKIHLLEMQMYDRSVVFEEISVFALK